MWRVALVLVLFAACSGHGDRGPAWPKRADREVDGGESLAPRTSSVVAASDDVEVVKPTAAAAADKPADAKAADKPAADKPATPTTVAPEEVITIDDIIIEIED